ncbi:hypothetical protein J6590_035437, partial [Homalodisca vitripennis]
PGMSTPHRSTRAFSEPKQAASDVLLSPAAVSSRVSLHNFVWIPGLQIQPGFAIGVSACPPFPTS